MQNLNAVSIPIFDRFTYSLLFLGWLAYVSLAPIYIFKSGLPQPADFIIAITAGLSIVLFFLKQRIVFNRVFAILVLMVVMFFAINISYFYFYKDTLFLYSSVYYVFNAFVFSATVILFKQNSERAVHWGRYAVFASIFIELVWLKTFDSASVYRETGSFNNPNQLGYWALLSSCYLLVLNYGRRMKWIDIIFFLLCGYIVTEALSRAVMISYVLLLASFFIGNYMSTATKIIMMGVVVFYTFFQVAVLDNPQFIIQNFEVVQKITERIETIEDEGSGVFVERGYGRIVEHPEYLFFGAGEGAYWRFSSLGVRGLELHSGLGTILFSYGLFGLALFGAFIFTIFQRAPLLLWVTLASIMLYGITHQHVRFTGFWLYLGLVYGVASYVVVPRRTEINSQNSNELIN